MKALRLISLLTVTALSLSLFGAVSTIMASASPTGTWTIYYYFSGSDCTGPYYSPTMKDGGGFAVNQPPSNNRDPIVSGGNSIDVNITVKGGLANENYYYEVEGLTSPVFLFKTDGSGSASRCMKVTIPSNSDTTNSTLCYTVPQKIGVGGISSKDFQGHIIDHFWTGAGCLSRPVPEFPLGILGLTAVALPALILMKRRISLVRPSP